MCNILHIDAITFHHTKNEFNTTVQHFFLIIFL